MVKNPNVSLVWWCTPLILALRRHRQADLWVKGQPGLQSIFQNSQSYTEKPCLQTKQTIPMWWVVGWCQWSPYSEAESGRSGVQTHLQLYSEFKVDYLSPYLKKQNNKVSLKLWLRLPQSAPLLASRTFGFEEQLEALQVKSDKRSLCLVDLASWLNVGPQLLRHHVFN